MDRVMHAAGSRGEPPLVVNTSASHENGGLQGRAVKAFSYDSQRCVQFCTLGRIAVLGIDRRLTASFPGQCG